MKNQSVSGYGYEWVVVNAVAYPRNNIVPNHGFGLSYSVLYGEVKRYCLSFDGEVAWAFHYH